MEREKAYVRMLDATARMQWNVAMILEAKAVESEKMRNWLGNHVSADAFVDHQGQLKGSIQLHDHVIETLEGLTKLGQGLTGVLKAALGTDDDSGGGVSGGMFGGSFELGDQ